MNAAQKQAVADEVTRKLAGTPGGGYYAMDPTPWWKRQVRRLFPSKHMEPQDEPEFMTCLEVRFSWDDKLRMLAGGVLKAEIRQGEGGATRSIVYVAPPRWLS